MTNKRVKSMSDKGKWISDECREGADLIWKQCDTSKYADGIAKLDAAAREGDRESWYFLGRCFSLGYGNVSVSREKAYDCYLRAARGGSSMAVLGALQMGQWDSFLQKAAVRTVAEAWKRVRELAIAGDPYASFQAAQLIENGALLRVLREQQSGKYQAPESGAAEDTGETASEDSAAEAPEKAADTGETASEDSAAEAPEKAADGGETASEDSAAEAPENPEPEESAASGTAAARAAARKQQAVLLAEADVPPIEMCIAYYQAAAAEGIISAIEKLGRCYQDGQYIPADEEQYLACAGECAKAGNAWGLCELGQRCAAEGNDDFAFQYFRAADIQGESRAALPLGRYYLEGKVTGRNVKAAEDCFEKAAESGDPGSFLELGNLFYRDELVERDDEKAFYWYSLAYSKGYREAALPLAKLYLRDTETKSVPKAVNLLQEASRSDRQETVREASLALGNIYRDGMTGKAEPMEAAKWYENGARAGSAECAELLGLFYYQGEDGVPADYEKAFAWLDRCYEKGTLQAVSKLATLYLEGKGCEADEKKAFALFQEASGKEYDGYAFYMLGGLYEKRGGADSLEKAVDCYQQASAMGYEGAAAKLGHFKKNLFGRWKVTG
jgi:TPR repeat protein